MRSDRRRPPLRSGGDSVNGLAVTLSILQNLGRFVPAARLQTDMTFLLRKLIERIEAIGDGENLAAIACSTGPLAAIPKSFRRTT